MKTVCLLRRDESGLSPEELALFRERFPGEEIKFVRADPKDWREHLAWCEANKPDVVLLPLERPIPLAAMEAGFVHIVIFPQGLVRLAKLEPIFEPL